MKDHELSGFVREVQLAFQDDREKIDQICKLLEDMQFRRIDASVFNAKMNNLFQRHKYLHWEFIKILPKDPRLIVSDFFKALKVVFQDHADYDDYGKREIHVTFPRWDELPLDVLDVISGKLYFDDLFQFSRVCTNWRVFHKSIDKSTSQEPLLLEFLNSPYKVPYSFTSLPNQKVYSLKKMMNNMLSYSDVSFPIFVTCSSGYFIIIADDYSFLLINPFTRVKKKVICPPTFQFSFHSRHTYRALLAFEQSSEDFVLLFLFRVLNNLHVYQSRNNGWVTYSHDYDDYNIVDFVAFNNIIYVLTEDAKIGVLNLNSPNIEFLKMVNSPDLDDDSSLFLNLVTCDEELLMVRLNPSFDTSVVRTDPLERKAYKIEFSTMSYMKLETLGDIALFYVCFKGCNALSNPNRWGYESNSVYEVSMPENPNCTVYSWDKKSKKYIAPLTEDSMFDWYFRHLKTK
ncbi:F-box only protein 6-like [Vicia villosa]|uniref:F-box only protein 6-like n=1 Tax=Vicia villosa TaxID=3911 RepID=UPI00273AEF2C|nr:F-box only protein 6-like [Vicia villosa]